MKKDIGASGIVLFLLLLIAMPLLSSCGTDRKESFICDITYTLGNNGNYIVIEETDTIQVLYNHNWYGMYLEYYEFPDKGEYKLKLYTENSTSSSFGNNGKTICVTSTPIICYSMHVHKLNNTINHDNISHLFSLGRFFRYIFPFIYSSCILSY